jgi:hypothetical protein
MKPSTALLCSGVILSLIFSLTALIIVTQNNGNLDLNSPNSPPSITPTTPEYTTKPPTSTPKPTATPSETDLIISYKETNRVENNGKTKITLTVDVTYKSGDAVTIKYSQLYLQLYVWRDMLPFPFNRETVAPKNSGSFTLGPAQKTQTFQLNFEFNTTGFNGMDPAKNVYQLQYNGPATIQWTNQDFY